MRRRWAVRRRKYHFYVLCAIKKWNAHIWASHRRDSSQRMKGVLCHITSFCCLSLLWRALSRARLVRFFYTISFHCCWRLPNGNKDYTIHVLSLARIGAFWQLLGSGRAGERTLFYICTAQDENLLFQKRKRCICAGSAQSSQRRSLSLNRGVLFTFACLTARPSRSC